METMRRRVALLIAAALSAGALSACSPAPPASPSSPVATPSGAASSSPPPPEPRVIATDLDVPWSVAFVGDTALISQRDSGDILELRDDGSTRVAGRVDGVAARGEAGLLGLAVDEEQRLYAFVVGDASSRIDRYLLDGAPGSYALGTGETIIDGLPAASFHAGGRIAFGPDGMLYATVGDAGDPSSAQDLESLGGKILRITPDGAVPPDNPFPNSPVYSYGHRNPQGIAWAADGTMFASEFGQDTWDELNVIEASSNYGWPEAEGIADDDRFVDPVQQWSADEASPSGITIADDTLYIANLRGERLRAVPIDDPSGAAELFVGAYGRLRDVVLTPSGEVWIVTSNTDGRGEPREGDDRILALAP